MAKMLSLEADLPNTFKSLRKLLIGGEAFPIDLAEALKPLAPAEIRNMYGPTETTVWSATYPLQGEERSIPIAGRIANTQIYILDGEQRIVPIGVAGELYIGGKGVVRGYLKQSGMTAERFVPDSMSKEVGARLYRTGDLARYRSDGEIEFLGRIDHQVKIRGYRIELGEIEAQLGSHPAVRHCVVVARQDETGEQRLVAYSVYEGEVGPSAGELRSYLKERLPEYMLPGWYVRLEEMPQTPNGKVDRRALPDPEVKSEGRVGNLASKTPTEEILAGIFQEALKLDRVGRKDNFFEIRRTFLIGDADYFADKGRLRSAGRVEKYLRGDDGRRSGKQDSRGDQGGREGSGAAAGQSAERGPKTRRAAVVVRAAEVVVHRSVGAG